MKEEKTKKKKSIYYVLLAIGILLLAAAAVLTVWFTTREADPAIEVPPTDQTPDETPDDDKDPSGTEEPDEPTGPVEPDDPTGPVEPEAPDYLMPVSAESCSVEYDAIYVSETTNFIYRHKAVDFAAAAGTEVLAIADGTVTAVSLSEELGNLITIDHGNGITSTYRFVEPADDLAVGAQVEQGACIGVVAEPYGSEAADGAHLHLEMTKDGALVDPAQYLEITYDEK